MASAQHRGPGSRLRSVHLRDVVEALDAKSLNPAVKFKGKTAVNVWSALKTLFDCAVSSKSKGMRVLIKNPALGVEGPEPSLGPELQWLYPRDFERVIRCRDIPLKWRRIYAFSTYLLLRIGEARALQWPSIDLESEMRLAIDGSSGEGSARLHERQGHPALPNGAGSLATLASHAG